MADDDYEPRYTPGRKYVGWRPVWGLPWNLISHLSIGTREGWTEQELERPVVLFYDIGVMFAALDREGPPVALVVEHLSEGDFAALLAREDFKNVPIFFDDPHNRWLPSNVDLPSNVYRYPEGFYLGLPKFKRAVLDRR